MMSNSIRILLFVALLVVNIETSLAGLVTSSTLKECQGRPADIYFLLDASTSVWSVDFKDRVLPFVKDLVSAFTISPRDTRVGVVTFSTDVDHSFGLSKHTDVESLLLAINKDTVKYLRGLTNTGDAIKDVTAKLAHARRGAAQVVITVTDGQSQQPRKTAAAAEEAKQQGVYMFAVGVGEDVDHQELRDIASDPDADFVFSVDNFSGLEAITGLLANKTCEVVKNTPPPPSPPTTAVSEPATTRAKEPTTTKVEEPSTTRATEPPTTKVTKPTTTDAATTILPAFTLP